MANCTHLGLINPTVQPSGEGCKECLETGGEWVHLRMCEICGHVGCCDSSPNKHATKHFHRTKHPIVRSFEPGENWPMASSSWQPTKQQAKSRASSMRLFASLPTHSQNL